jgi:hypothetical protein
MTDLNITQLLRDADPARDDDGLTVEDAQAMRQAILAAVPADAPVMASWFRPLAMASMAALIAAVSSIAGHRAVSTIRSIAGTLPAGPAPILDAAEVDCRQLQFATPGGTRIIWVFDENLRLQEPMP